MDPNDSFYHQHHHHRQQQQLVQPHHHQQQQQPQQNSSPPSKADGGGGGTTSPPPVMYTQSVQPADSAVRRKRGRPRKYGTPEQALAAKKATSLAASAQGSNKKRGTAGNATKRSNHHHHPQLAQLGNAGQGFTPHIINVTAGEDVYQRIMLFMQQSGREICILSASGSISNASLRQPATSGGGIMYEGRFELVSLSGSYVRTDNGGRSGGLSVCLSDTNSQIIGGGVGGPLVAAGPVQVIIGSFLIEPNKGNGGVMKSDCPASHLTSPIGTATMQVGAYRPTIESERVQGRNNDEHHNVAGNPFMIQSRNMHIMSSQATDWMGGSDARSGGSYEFLGRAGHAPFRSSENGDYNQMTD